MSKIADLFREDRISRGLPPEPDVRTKARFEFAALLMTLRQGAGVSQRELSDRSGVPQSEISRIERALTVPSVERFERIVNALGFHMTAVPVNAPHAAVRERELVHA